MSHFFFRGQEIMEIAQRRAVQEGDRLITGAEIAPLA
jgi:hypothetical protein